MKIKKKVKKQSREAADKQKEKQAIIDKIFSQPSNYLK